MPVAVQCPLWELPLGGPASTGNLSAPLSHIAQCMLILFQICQSHKSCEIDPVKLKDGENLESNMVKYLLCSGTLSKGRHLLGVLVVAP